MKTFAIFGAFAQALILVFAFTPGLRMQVYFGTEAGARAWHKRQCTPEETHEPSHSFLSAIHILYWENTNE